MPRVSRWREAASAVAGVGGAILVVMFLWGSTGTPHVVIGALGLLAVVLATASVSTLRVAVFVTLVATLAFNFFFLPPIHTFTLADPQNRAAFVIFLGVAGVVAFLLQRSRLLAEREAARAATARAEVATALLASLSHDLRTPLTAVRMAVTNLASGDALDAEGRTQAAVAVTEIERLTRLFDNILAMARVESGTIAAERQWVTPADILDAVVAQLESTLGRRKLRIEAESDAHVYVDPRLTSAALVHVLENAAKYTPPDSTIEITGSSDANGLRVVIRDHGAGLSESELEHLFDRFYRGTASRRHPGGTGMGLAISRGLLAAEGGTIVGDNAPGGGARFTILVPAPVRAVAEQAV
jgi:two-component system sensor histidine kinase KdpD